MQNSERLLEYLQQGIDALLEEGSFDGGQEFRPTQGQALSAYKNFLNDERLTPAERLKGFFEIPTGVGKTAIFVGIVAAAHKAAEQNGDELKTAVVVPTIQLLEQTQKAFAKFAPDLAKKIGLYGGGKRSLSHPLTIMTYDAWFDLSQQGKISSENIDILISDEAHRGTSERRIENIKDVFNEHTAQIALTATAHFDDEKSVEGSHEREIFYKPTRDAIKGGELAAYIQSQRAVIRVEPSDYMLTEAFGEASEGDQIKYRRALRQRAWNDFAVKAFREGRDERSGDLLTDNQAGFFVDGIQQSDELEELLNSDSELQKRAVEQGKQSVAVAIHSGLSPKEQKRRFEAYLNGEYMAVIGDEKFKEGFDHPPMKTIIDYPHSSVVDKLQILGRGARKWWNEAKQRYEGLTIIDTAIYIGSANEDEDEKARDYALRSAVSIKDVLEESAVFADEDEYWFPKGGGGGGSVTKGHGYYVFDDDPNIEYITDLAEIYALECEIEQLRKGFILTLNDIKDSIDAYRAANNGRNPSQNTDDIEHGPLAGTMKWISLNWALTYGANKLDQDPEWQRLNEKLGERKVTLSNLLIELGYKKKLSQLTISLIRETIEAYRAANNDENPKIYAGDIGHGPLAEMFTWGAIHASLSYGGNGLKEDPEWQRLSEKLGEKKITLASLLIELGYEQKPEQLTISIIRETIDAYRAANNNKNPTNKSGNITEGPLAGQGKWQALDASIQKGQRGLKEDHEWQKLNEKLGEGKLTLSNLLVELGYKKQLPKLTMNIIIETINAYREANEGKNPKAALKQIEGGPLAGLMTWDTLYAALVAGARGLKEDPEWKKLNQKLGKITLPALLADLGYKDQTREITIQEVCQTIEAYRAAHNNKNPTVSSGNMSEGPLTGLLGWGQLNQMLSLGSNGFREDDEWQRLNEKLGTVTLSRLLIELGHKEKPLELTISAIRETVEVYRRTHDGKNPSEHSGDITEGPFAGLITWGGLNSALRIGGNNLKGDSEWQKLNEKYGGKFSLSKMCRKYPANLADQSPPRPEDGWQP